MTSRKDIQSLIDEIDGILPKAGFRLPWSRRTDAASYDQLLERVRRHLVSLEQNSSIAPEERSHQTSQPEVVQQVVQAVSQEINSLRADLQGTLQTELAELRQQRDFLVQEIRQLDKKEQEIKAQNRLSLDQQQFISEISQKLVNRCVEALNQQLGEIIANQTAAELDPSTSESGKTKPVITSLEQLEQLKQIQFGSDQLLKTLDNNQQVIFETLQSNLRAYQESLSQGLEKMYNLGSQGEIIFAELIERLRQPLAEDATNAFSQLVSPTQLKLKTDSTVANTTPNQENHPLSQASSPAFPSAPRSNTSGRDNQEKIAKSDSTTPTTTQNQQNIPEGGFLEPEVEPEENQQLENFLQLDVEAKDLLPLVVEDRELLERSWDQELDSLFELVAQQVTPLSTSPSESLADEGQATVQTPSGGSECKRQETDDLYKSLFLSDSLAGLLPTDELEISSRSISTNSIEVNGASSAPAAENGGFEEQVSSLESGNQLSNQVEEILFEGITDPASLANREEQDDLSLEQLPQPWETLFSQNSAASSSQKQSLASSATEQIKGENSPEDITIITALTDLFQDTNHLREDNQAIIDNSVAATTEDLLSNGNSLTINEDNYVVASPEEILLATEQSERELNQEIHLDPSTMEQLREDINRFGISTQSADVAETKQNKLPESNLHQPVVEPGETRETSPPQNLLPLKKSEELLAEDWEEFVASEWSEPNSFLDNAEMEMTKDQSNSEPD